VLISDLAAARATYSPANITDWAAVASDHSTSVACLAVGISFTE
jgi:hypothetical protein